MLTRWSDFDTAFTIMDELRKRMDRVWDDYEVGRTESPYGAAVGRGASWPRLNLFDTGTSFVIHAEVPGLEDKDVQLTVNQDVVTLKGERKADGPEGYSVHRQERGPVRFARSFTLPARVDSERTTAQLKNGVLSINLPKVAEAQPRQIAVRAQ